MKKFVLFGFMALNVFTVSALAAQEPITVEIGGAKAREIMDKMERTLGEGAEVVQNTIGMTTYRNGNVTCTLYGAHAGSPLYKKPIYSCEIELSKAE